MKIENKCKYYMYIISKDQLVEFKDKKELIVFVRNRNNEYFFEEVNLTGKDTIKRYDFLGDKIIINRLRDFIFYDEYNRIIDIRDFKDIILNEEDFYPKKKEKPKYEFRRGPVPKLYSKKRKKKYDYISNNKKHFFKEVKDSCLVDEKYLKKNRHKELQEKLRNLRYGEYNRNKVQKSWKEQSKKKRQWM